ncbi:MAG: redoxin family protein [Clostridia bacterium]|nr:redoxin family protein [Clostridia bacterium]
MGKIKRWWNDHRPTTRRLAQLYAALLYNAHIKGFAEGKIYTGNMKALCTPGLNCYSCPGAVGACPLGALQNAMASVHSRAGYYVLGIVLLYGLILGRTICGWLCPMGLVQELLYKIPTPKIKKSRVTRALTYCKYILLGVFVLAVPLWYGWTRQLPLPAFCKYICPAGTLEGAVMLLPHPDNASLFSMLGGLFTRKWVIMLVVGLACVFCYRAFCRFLCPLGAIYGLFSRLALLSVRGDGARCDGCGACVRRCPMDIRRVGDRECIHCARCMAVCPQKAIAMKAGGIVLMAPDEGAGQAAPGAAKRRRLGHVLWGIALGVLLAAVLWFNVLEPAVLPVLPLNAEMSEGADDIPTGYEVGMRLPEFEAELVGGGTFRLADTRGKVTMINLWATYCAPCVQELPSFAGLLAQYPDDIAVLAVHSSLVTEDVGEYLAARDWAMPFAVDTADDRLFRLVGGSALLPQTIVLDRKGVVIYNQVGSVNDETLLGLFQQAKEL